MNHLLFLDQVPNNDVQHERLGGTHLDGQWCDRKS